MISKFFIERPILANVIAILIIVIGGVAVFGLPVAQYPDVVPPTVQVSTRYPGASAETVIKTVALPIEQEVNGVQGMIYMQSYAASDGSYTLTVTFKIGTDLNFSQVLVQNRVSEALASLPDAVQSQGVTVRKKSTSILQIVALTSPDKRYNSLFMSNYATINLKDEISRLPGVGNVTVFGAGQYAMRIWLDPQEMKARGLTVSDVTNALKQQNVQVTAGQIGTPPSPGDVAFQYTLNVAGRLDDPAQFANVVLKTGSNGQLTRVRDVGRVELGAQTYSQDFKLDDKAAAGLAIFLSPGANALNVANEVTKRMTALKKNFPPGLTYSIPFDTTVFVKASIDEVYKTLFEATILVLIVILVFLQDWRAMLVPATTVPVTIIGAFAAMWALGFTVNFATLFAIVLAIGIVVDDAIIVVEGAAHNIDKGMNGPQASIAAMNVLLGPIIGITLVLLAVFLPASFLPGLTGQMYAQFALVIAATALISAVNAVTLKPTQCALWLRPTVPVAQRNIFYRGFDAAYAWLERVYTAFMTRLVRHARIMAFLGLAIIVATVWAFSRVPTGFIPYEDQGYMLAIVQLPDGASLGRTQDALAHVSTLARKNPGVKEVVSIAGVSPLDNNSSLSSSGIAYIILKDWAVRGKKYDLRHMLAGLNNAMSGVEEAQVRVLPPPPIQGVGFAAGFTMQVNLEDGSSDYSKLARVVRNTVSDAASQSEIQMALSSFRAETPQYTVDVNRVKAQSMHVNVNDVFNALAGYLGSTYVNQFNKFGRTFQVFVQAGADYRQRLRDIDHLTVRNSEGNMVPLGTLVSIRPTMGPSLISLYNLYPSATIIGMPRQGYSSGQAMALMREIAKKTFPPHVSSLWSAMSYQENLVGNQMYMVFGMALLLVYLVLAGQYESWYRPLAVLCAVPITLIGPVAALTALNIDNNLYTQIGIVLLIALSAKNAILIVEFARELREGGMPIAEAAVEAARARFRPILMTSFAFIMGVLPLVLATGAGASARASTGIAVFTGMLASTCIAILFVPSFFAVIQGFEEWRLMRKGKPVPAAAASK
jgi:hydrophobic/amphiphilic exporter-1 (mainly G- bacteria), HAE1 family